VLIKDAASCYLLLIPGQASGGLRQPDAAEWAGKQH
jgi:hypothetical protein